jgi:hypothetical protein
MGLSIKSFDGGTVELVPADTASNVTVNIQASNGLLVYANSATGGLFLPSGTTAQRPASPVTGQMRFNTTTGFIETYNGSVWS